MHKKYIVRLPIKDRNNHVIAHEIVYSGDREGYGTDDSFPEMAAADAVSQFLTQANIDKKVPSFMTFTASLLAKQIPSLFAPDDLIIQIDDNVVIHPLSMQFIKQYEQEGYRIAVNDFQFSPRYMALIDKIDYIKINGADTAVQAMHDMIDVAHSMGKSCIVDHISNEKLYQQAIDLKADALEGTFVAEKINTKINSNVYLQSNFFRILTAVTAEEPDLDEIEKMIAVDAGLSYGLLKLVNSVGYGVRNKITDLHQVIVHLGVDRLRQWIYLLSVSNANGTGDIDSESQEFLKKSLLRGEFCSLLSDQVKNLNISHSDAYLLGIFSTLDHLIDAPMEEILADIPLKEEVSQALIHEEGRAGLLLKLVRCYENADWTSIAEVSQELDLSDEEITGTYFRCADRVNDFWQKLINGNA